MFPVERAEADSLGAYSFFSRLCWEEAVLLRRSWFIMFPVEQVDAHSFGFIHLVRVRAGRSGLVGPAQGPLCSTWNLGGALNRMNVNALFNK
jgi:hypothetical protein